MYLLYSLYVVYFLYFFILPVGKDTYAVTRDGPGCTRVTPGEEVKTRVLQLECKVQPQQGSGKNYILPAG